MLYLGCHLSFGKGFYAMGRDALSINANVFQYFSRNPRGGKAKEWDKNDIQKFQALAKENNFGKILVHAPYTLNPCSNSDSIRQFAYDIMSDDLERLEMIPYQYYNFHPGSHVGQGVEKGIQYIVDFLNSILKEKYTTTILLETMAGKGSEVGSRFEEIATIIKQVHLNNKLGVCLDTCHVSDAGYDIINNLDSVLEEFDTIIGLDRLKAIHLNDSKNPLASHKDRHECIGKGTLGIETFCNILTHPKLSGLPFYLETPNELLGYGEEIKLLRELTHNN